jgi:hypothetical protein
LKLYGSNFQLQDSTEKCSSKSRGTTGTLLDWGVCNACCCAAEYLRPNLLLHPFGFDAERHQ